MLLIAGLGNPGARHARNRHNIGFMAVEAIAAEHRIGRLFVRYVLKTRISPGGWDPEPMQPAVAAGRIAPVPVLIVHGDKDLFFPPDHGRELYDGAREPRELWLLPGFGHAERGADDKLIDRIAAWVTEAVSKQNVPPEAAAAG